MNPVLIILILIGGGLLWLLCSFTYRPIGKLFKKLWDDAKGSMFDEDRTVKTFDTKDKAEEYVKGLLGKAAYYAKRLANRYHEAEEDKKGEVIDQIIKDINEFTGTQFSVLSDFVFDMLTKNCELKSFECTLDEYGYKIIQCIA